MEEGGDTVPLLPSPVDHGTEADAGSSEAVADGTGAGNDDDDNDDDLLNVAAFTYPNVYVSF